MPAQQKVAKGLPRRHSNVHLKEARARRWWAGQERKRLRQEANQKAFQRNQRLRAEGKPTPWETATQRRKLRMNSDPIRTEVKEQASNGRQ